MYIPYLDCIHTEHVKSKMQCFMGAESHAVSAYQEAGEARLLMTSVGGTLEPGTIALPHPSPCKEVWTPFLHGQSMDSVIIILVLEASLSNILSLLMGELKEGYLLKGHRSKH